MSRFVNATAEVTSFAVGRDGKQWPHIFICRGTRYEADLDSPLSEYFVVVGEWWKTPAPDGVLPEAQFYRLALVGGGLVELVHEQDGSWRLYKVYD